ncbi:MAG: sigma-70 family RNA polymerase sigma factor [Okeania sp. SIO3B5]|uniref:RNA polymerase sigma factor n=1 Tax=Okeania sp. SIO3B5 TaxID=2607811 RepID=UPI0013FE883D|nr:sigma-70 family RNA polymerase sigma factor [Okeania sp. SIO3B5]NEO55648.1 sigma-70 family RNA polymerase sigma factor [Okeania sp. SIO3B5]
MVHFKTKQKEKLTDPLPGGDTTEKGGSMAMLATLTPAPVAAAPGKGRNPHKLEKEDTENEFWQVWCDHRDRLYRCCLRLMNSNHADAEDALSEAMVKALDKVRKFAGKIANLPAWLMTLTRNLCLDIIRKRSRGAVGVDDIEWVGDSGEMGVASAVELPEQVLEKDERSVVIRRAIASLPGRMRETFILHFYEELSYQEIIKRQGISIDCVYKRISQAWKKLKEKLSDYFIMSQVEAGKISQSPPKKEERPLKRSHEVLKENEKATVKRETEAAFVEAVEKPEMVESPVESREQVEVKIPEAVTASAEVDVDVAECSESVELVGEDISDVAGVCGENELRPILPGELSPSTLELTWRRDVWECAPLPECGREMLAACLIREVIDPENSVAHKGAVGNWWRLSRGTLSSILDMVGVVIRRFFNVPDSSRSFPRFLVKGNNDGERRRWVMGARLVEMVGAIGLKIPRLSVW